MEYSDELIHAGEELVEDYLTHHGVKGMKWGTRHGNSSSPSAQRSKEIHEARLRTANRLSQIEHHANAVSSANSQTEKQHHVDAIHKLAREGLTSGDVEKGSHSTRAEKLISSGIGGVTGFVAGPGGPLLTAGAGLGAQQAFRAHQKSHTAKVLNMYANSSVKDYEA